MTGKQPWTLINPRGHEYNVWTTTGLKSPIVIRKSFKIVIPTDFDMDRLIAQGWSFGATYVDRQSGSD